MMEVKRDDSAGIVFEPVADLARGDRGFFSIILVFFFLFQMHNRPWPYNASVLAANTTKPRAATHLPLCPFAALHFRSFAKKKKEKKNNNNTPTTS